MFTGIVEELGVLKNIIRRVRVTLLCIESKVALQGVQIGDSIAVNGACLTVIGKSTHSLDFEVMPETMKVTNLGALRLQDKVNLERALQAGDRISGHFVNGHVDCQGLIRKKTYSAGNLSFEIAIPGKFMPYITPKGSVAVDGISLTVAEKKNSTFSVYIISHTLKNTTLSFKGPSSKVNIECDILVKSALGVS